MARSITCVSRRAKTVQKMTVVGENQEDRTKDHLQARPGDLSRHTGVQIRDPRQPPPRAGLLNPGVCIDLSDERAQKHERFLFKDGITEFNRFLQSQQRSSCTTNPSRSATRLPNEDPAKAGTMVDVAMQYNDSYNDQIFAYANSIFNLEGARTCPASARP